MQAAPETLFSTWVAEKLLRRAITEVIRKDGKFCAGSEGDGMADLSRDGDVVGIEVLR